MSQVRRTPGVRRELIEKAYAHAVGALQPNAAVCRVLKPTEHGFAVNGQNVDIPGNLVVISIGKAAAPMASAVGEMLGGRIDTGMILTKDGHLSQVPEEFRGFEASHPVPDERGIDASRAILGAVERLTEDDVVLALISGGGSALFESPREGLTLEDIQEVTDLLLRAGAPIQDLNGVRSELSDVKGGGFRRAIGPARTVSLILSDVLGNAPDVIASGPTIVREPDAQRAVRVLEAYGLVDQVPEPVARVLKEAQSAAQRSSLVNANRDLFEIIGDNVQFVDEVATYLEDRGLSVHGIWANREGEAKDQAIEWIRAAGATDADAVIGGGELTVTVRGNGVGGRNTEFALVAAKELSTRGIVMTVASLASDGQDGSADAAGAIVDESTAAALRARRVDIEEALEANDSATALATIGALIVPGPTGTNVNDVYIAVRESTNDA